MSASPSIVFRELNAHAATNTTLEDKSQKLLKNYIHVVRFGITDDVSQHTFPLNAVFFHGIKSTLLFDNTFKYSLVFALHQTGYVECIDLTDSIIADIERGLITGMGPQQVYERSALRH